MERCGKLIRCECNRVMRHQRGVMRAMLMERCGKQIRCECNGVMRCLRGVIRAMLMERCGEWIRCECNGVMWCGTFEVCPTIGHSMERSVFLTKEQCLGCDHVS